MFFASLLRKRFSLLPSNFRGLAGRRTNIWRHLPFLMLSILCLGIRKNKNFGSPGQLSNPFLHHVKSFSKRSLILFRAFYKKGGIFFLNIGSFFDSVKWRRYMFLFIHLFFHNRFTRLRLWKKFDEHPLTSKTRTLLH